MASAVKSIRVLLKNNTNNNQVFGLKIARKPGLAINFSPLIRNNKYKSYDIYWRCQQVNINQFISHYLLLSCMTTDGSRDMLPG